MAHKNNCYNEIFLSYEIRELRVLLCCCFYNLWMHFFFLDSGENWCWITMIFYVQFYAYCSNNIKKLNLNKTYLSVDCHSQWVLLPTVILATANTMLWWYEWKPMRDRHASIKLYAKSTRGKSKQNDVKIVTN